MIPFTLLHSSDDTSCSFLLLCLSLLISSLPGLELLGSKCIGKGASLFLSGVLLASNALWNGETKSASDDVATG